MQANNIIPLFIAIPLAGAFLISLLGKKVKWLPDVLSLAVAAACFGLALLAVRLNFIYGTMIYRVGGWVAPIGISMVLDGLSAFMLVTVTLVALCIVLYSVNYMEKFTAKWRFYTLFFLMLGGMNGVVATGDMFNLFVFLEIAAVASYALVAFGTERQELEAAFKYAIMGTVGSSFILLGIALLYGYTSTLNMADMGMILAQKGAGRLIMMVSIMFLMGFGLKAALVPFHAWLPDAHPSAPAPISAMLSGVLIKSLGIYALIRIFYNVIGITQNLSSILLVLGTLSMVVGGLLALGQWDFKRLLAYSSISQIGYIILGFGLATPLGILGGLFHLFNHSIFKSLLFLNSGAVEYATGTRDLRKMGGLNKVMPLTGATTMIGSMSIAGIPPFNGFWSKLIIIIAAVQAGKFGYAFWAVLVSILTLAMYIRMMRYAFLGNLASGLQQVKEVPLLMKLSMGALALVCLAGVALLLPGVYEMFLQKAQETIIQGTEYAAAVLQGI